MFDFKNILHQKGRRKPYDPSEDEEDSLILPRRRRKRRTYQQESHSIAPNIEHRGDTEKCKLTQPYAEQRLRNLIDYTGGAHLSGLQRMQWLDDGGYIHASTAAGIHKIKIFHPVVEGEEEEAITPRALRPVMASYNAQQYRIFWQDPNGEYNFFIDLAENNAFAPYSSTGGTYSWAGYERGSSAYYQFMKYSLNVLGFAVREIPATEGVILYYDHGADMVMVLHFQVLDLDVAPTDATEYLDFDLFGDIANDRWSGDASADRESPLSVTSVGRDMYSPGGSYGLGIQRFYKKPFNFYQRQFYDPHMFRTNQGHTICCGDVNGEPLARIQDLKWSWVGQRFDAEDGLTWWADVDAVLRLDHTLSDAIVLESINPIWWDGGDVRNVPCITQALNATFDDIDPGTIWYAKWCQASHTLVHWPSGDTFTSEWGSYLRDDNPLNLLNAPGGGIPTRYAGAFWKAWQSGGSYYRDITTDYYYDGRYYHGENIMAPSPNADYLFSPAHQELLAAYSSESPYHLPIDFVPVCEITAVHTDLLWLWWPAPSSVMLPYTNGWVTFEITGRSWSDVTESEETLTGYNSNRRNNFQFALYRGSKSGYDYAADYFGRLSVYSSAFGYIFGDVSYLEHENA